MLENELENLLVENETLYNWIRDLTESNYEMVQKIEGKDYEKPSYLIEEVQDINGYLATLWIEGVSKKLFDEYVIQKYMPDYKYESELKHYKSLNKYYYYELHDLIAKQNLYTEELKNIKTKSL